MADGDLSSRAAAVVELAGEDERPSLGSPRFVYSDKGPVKEERSHTSILPDEQRATRSGAGQD